MKKIAKAIVSMGAVLAFAGCSWQIPQTVSVKTNADYSFSLGNFTNDLGDSMDTTSMMGETADSRITKYDYFPGKLDKNTQHYLLEVKVLEETLVNASDAQEAFTAAGTDSMTVGNGSNQLNISLGTNSTGKMGLNFNPATMLSEITSSFGDDVSGKIKYASVPMYLYCETVEGLEAEVDLRMFYSASNDVDTEREGTSEDILTDAPITNTPLPSYVKEGDTIITNLSSTRYIGKVRIKNGQPVVDANGDPVLDPIEIKDRLNLSSDNIEDDDQLSIQYTISNFSGTVTEAAAHNGVTLKLYAVIDLPVEFQVSSSADVTLDVSKMSGESDSSSSSSSSSESSSSSGDSEFSKYLNVMDSVSIKYVVYQLPIYAANGMQLWVDLLGDGANYDKGSDIVFVDKNKTITDADKSSITLKTATIQRMKANANFNPNFVLFLRRNSVFSLPREKMIDMNLEMSFKTDGTIQVK